MSPSQPSDSDQFLPNPDRIEPPVILVIGHRGMLGQDLLAQLECSRISATGLDLPDIDITRADQVIESLKPRRPRVVVNCAAYTAVDRAESEPDLAFAVNRDGAGNLAMACRNLGIPLIHISTDYIFDGRAPRPYREEDPANPLGVYGQSKWEGEEAIRVRLPQHLIVRTAWMFGLHGSNFVKSMLRLAREREELRVVSDQHGCPTWTVDLADAIVTMVIRLLDDSHGIEWGTYHFCGEGKTTWHAFAEEIVRVGRRHEALKTTRVVPITTADYPTPAHRPAWSVLECTKIGRSFGIVPRPWRVGLLEVIKGIHHTANG